ncbi:MAG TPA: adenylyltransferase/cytidyltransferase family protein, partial [Thermodesulfobacteriota bacterium]|nr:adenylyltransferase/cytidyltransferase family protein [Thermodesulfobacteriota bacterium]
MNDRSRSSPDRCTTADRQNQTAAKRIGLFGGTFNPIHLGHLRGAEEIYEAFHLNSVIFVPALIPPHKNAEGMIAPEHRLAMVRAAIENNQAFSVSDFELRQDRIS